MEVEDLIEHYFNLGLSQDDILSHLRGDGVVMSSRTLKRKLKFLNLYRRKNYASVEDVITFLSGELEKSGSLLGYKWMWLRMIQNKFTVTQETVRLALNLLDPEGVALRSKGKLKRRSYTSQGANFLWHQDGYDKLKPYGICINGAIDGFSRYVGKLNK